MLFQDSSTLINMIAFFSGHSLGVLRTELRISFDLHQYFLLDKACVFSLVSADIAHLSGFLV